MEVFCLASAQAQAILIDATSQIFFLQKKKQQMAFYYNEEEFRKREREDILKGVAENDPGYLYRMGSIYEFDNLEFGYLPDLEQARQFYERAAALGDSDAQMALCRLMSGVPGRMKEMIKLANQGHEDAKRRLVGLFDTSFKLQREVAFLIKDLIVIVNDFVGDYCLQCRVYIPIWRQNKNKCADC
jgi:hypothetical protein